MSIAQHLWYCSRQQLCQVLMVGSILMCTMNSVRKADRLAGVDVSWPGPTMMSKEARAMFLNGGGEEALQAWKVKQSRVAATVTMQQRQQQRIHLAT